MRDLLLLKKFYHNYIIARLIISKHSALLTWSDMEGVVLLVSDQTHTFAARLRHIGQYQ